jgi:hypothetical protein
VKWLCMPNRSSNRGKGHKDMNEIAFSVVQQATGQAPKNRTSRKESGSSHTGRLGGLKGGKARAEQLTAKRRSEIARKAALKRWESTR